MIAAPPGPLVVIAGAGAGKTETMAARVVWLVANGYAEPGQVLGLTFTRKAAGQLLRRVRSRLARLAGIGLGATSSAGAAPVEAADTPVVSTYHAFAGSLLRDYGLLLPVEPDARLLSETELWQLAFDVVNGYDGRAATPTRPRPRSPRWCCGCGVSSPSTWSTPASCAIPTWSWSGWFITCRRVPTSATAAPASGCCGCWPPRPSAPSWCRCSTRCAERMRAAKVMDFGAQMASAARLAATFPQVGQDLRSRYPGGAARRIPGHRARPARRAVGAVRRRPSTTGWR